MYRVIVSISGWIVSILFEGEKTATMSNEFIVKFRSFDKVECRFDIVAGFGNEFSGFGNNVEAAFDL